MKKQSLYEPKGIYHIFNHANGKENLFQEEENYQYFLRKYAEKLSSVVDTLAYCLMPNHFHLLIRIKEKEILWDYLSQKIKLNPNLSIPENSTEEELNHYIVHRQFHNFLGGYSKAFNKFHNRSGSLLRQNTRRKIVNYQDYLKNSIRYVHLNSVFHDFTVFPEEWPHNSYHAYLCDKPTQLIREEVLGWFGGRDEFIKFHQKKLGEGLNGEWEQ